MPEIISRREVFSLLGIATALAFAVPTTLLTASDAEAQAQGTPQGQPSQPSQPGQPGTRQARRTARTERRQARRTARAERREKRTTSGSPPSSGGSTPK